MFSLKRLQPLAWRIEPRYCSKAMHCELTYIGVWRGGSNEIGYEATLDNGQGVEGQFTEFVVVRRVVLAAHLLLADEGVLQCSPVPARISGARRLKSGRTLATLSGQRAAGLPSLRPLSLCRACSKRGSRTLSILPGSSGRTASSTSERLTASVRVMPCNSTLTPGFQYQPNGVPLSLHCSGNTVDRSRKSRSMLRRLIE